MNTEDFDRIAAQIPFYSTQLLRLPQDVKDQAFDIHFKAGAPVAVCGAEGTFFLTQSGLTRALTENVPVLSSAQLQELFLAACSHSVFSHEEELRQGYFMFGQGCRAGVCGTAVWENGQMKSVRDITSLVFRIPRNMTGCADRLFLEGTDLSHGVLLAGEPSSGKTTLLRDLSRSLSIGKFSPVRRVAVLDERGEFSFGELGPCADVLRGYEKSLGFQVALKMLSPEFLICDELSPQDLSAVRGVALSGASLVASVHASCLDFTERPLCRELLETGAFATVVFLGERTKPGEICEIRQVR